MASIYGAAKAVGPSSVLPNLNGTIKPIYNMQPDILARHRRNARIRKCVNGTLRGAARTIHLLEDATFYRNYPSCHDVIHGSCRRYHGTDRQRCAESFPRYDVPDSPNRRCFSATIGGARGYTGAGRHHHGNQGA